MGSRVRTGAALAVGLLAGCGSSSAITCGELRSEPAGFASQAMKLYGEEVANEDFEVPEGDCDARCERAFTAGIERQLRKECRNAEDGHEPTAAVRDWIGTD
jgi:hypothetical protein